MVFTILVVSFFFITILAGEVHHDYSHFLVVPIVKTQHHFVLTLVDPMVYIMVQSFYVPKHYLYCDHYDSDLPFVGHKGSITISLCQSVDCIITHHLDHLGPLVGAHCLCACNYLGFDVVFIVASIILQNLLSFLS
jgi:hypothetical protein